MLSLCFKFDLPKASAEASAPAPSERLENIELILAIPRVASGVARCAATAITLLGAIAVVSPVMAEDEPTVQRLLGYCERALAGTGNGFETGYCLGLVWGLTQVLSLNCGYAVQGRPHMDVFMSETPPTVGAGAQAFVNWARGHPEVWGSTDAVGVAGSLVATFPCKMKP